MRQIVVIAHNMRSTHNVGSLLRTAEGLGINKVFLTGYTPYPLLEIEDRLPHLAQKLDQQIDKTALGAAKMIDWQKYEALEPVISELKNSGFTIAALEQSKHSIELHKYKAPDKLALLLGPEVEGLSKDLLALTDICLEIPMYGQKESFNVVQAAAMALYRLRFY